MLKKWVKVLSWGRQIIISIALETILGKAISGQCRGSTRKGGGNGAERA